MAEGGGGTCDRGAVHDLVLLQGLGLEELVVPCAAAPGHNGKVKTVDSGRCERNGKL